MAELDISGMEETLMQMKQMGKLSGDVAREMLKIGNEKMVDAWRESIDVHGHIDTGEMRKKVGPTTIKNIPGGVAQDVYPQGVHARGNVKTRNAEKAFVLHYGRKNMDASHFVDHAVAKGKPQAEQAMEKRWDRFIETGR